MQILMKNEPKIQLERTGKKRKKKQRRMKENAGK
jgi:hypothetical protein